MSYAHFNDMAWPLPDHHLSWKLRYQGIYMDEKSAGKISRSIRAELRKRLKASEKDGRGKDENKRGRSK